MTNLEIAIKNEVNLINKKVSERTSENPVVADIYKDVTLEQQHMYIGTCMHKNVDFREQLDFTLCAEHGYGDNRMLYSVSIVDFSRESIEYALTSVRMYAKKFLIAGDWIN